MQSVSEISGSERMKPLGQSGQAAEPARLVTAKRQEMFVVVVKDFSELEQYVPAWEELADAALEPNPFYESWMLMPALESFGAGKDLRFVLIFAPDKVHRAKPPIHCAMFPLERKRRYKGMPVSALRLWKHKFCFLCTPLVRKDCVHDVMAVFFDWLRNSPKSSPLFEFQFVAGDGPLYQVLVDLFYERASLTFTADRYNRALFQPASDAPGYLKAAISREHRKDLRRKERRLTEMEGLEYIELRRAAELDEWLEEFLRIENSGWKREEGGALACDESSRNFFLRVATEAFRRDRLMLLSARAGGRTIAQKCNFLAGRGSFAFKIAFDEDYSQFSPGVLMEIENIRRLHARPQIEWMDSCAIPDHFMINRLWPARRSIQSVVLSTGRRFGDLAVSLLPVLRWANRKRLAARRSARPTV